MIESSASFPKAQFSSPENMSPRSIEPVSLEEARDTSTPIEISIVMPCLNEAETLAICIEKAQRAFKEHHISGEIVIADNGSTDGSPQIATRLGARVVHIENKGYGSALMGGIQAARGQYILMGDADDSYNFGDVHLFAAKLREGNDLVMGNRFKGGIKPGAMRPLHRYLGNPVLTGIGKLFFKSPCGDFHCGLRGFRKSAIETLDLQTTGMEFASEMVVKATLNKLRIAEVPTTLSPDGRSRPPHLRSWRDGWRHLRFLLLYSPRWLFLYPGALMMILGTMLMFWLMPGVRVVGGIGLDIHTMLYAAASIVIGFQAVNFALFTKVFAISQGLLPGDARVARLFRYVSLETGLIMGLILVLSGLGGSAYALTSWGERAFGALEPSNTFRVVIPSVTSMIIGFQCILSSFFLSVLRLK